MTEVDTAELVYHTAGAGPCPQPDGQPCEEGTEPGPEVVVVGKNPPPAADVGTRSSSAAVRPRRRHSKSAVVHGVSRRKAGSTRP